MKIATPVGLLMLCAARRRREGTGHAKLILGAVAGYREALEARRFSRLLLAVTMAVTLTGVAFAEETKGEPCTGFVKEDTDALAKRFVKLGAKGRIIDARCNARGNLSVLTIQRPSDNRITRWKPRDGLTALIDRVMAGE